MITLNDCKRAGQHSLKGVSTDVKPVDYSANSLFFQLNGGIFYYLKKGDDPSNATNWRKVGT